MASISPKPFARRPAPVPAPGGFSSVVVIALGAVAALALLWGGIATWYILCKDDFVQTFLARQAEMRFAYEDQVGDLKNRLEREITAGLVERKGFGARVDALVKRQQEIEARQIWLAGLTERMGGSATARLVTSTAPTIQPTAPAQSFQAVDQTGSVSDFAPRAAKPTPIQDAPLDLRLRSQGDEPAVAHSRDRLSALEDSLRRLSEEAVATTDALRRDARDRAQSIRQALAATRVPLPLPPARDAASASGGPFIPAPTAYDAAAFAPIAADAEGGVAEIERLAAAARALPVGKPLQGDLEQTSGFGYRVDPFNRSAALHSGVDFRTAYGAPVRSTAAGRVTVAEYTGGYGNMVEIEHEGGVATRYGHLSAISVAPGQRVELGQVVGRAGSTGRSTGTHLHYETRIDGEAVNPTRFLEAGRLLARIH